MAQCWCDWIDDDLNVSDVTHVIFNLYNGARPKGSGHVLDGSEWQIPPALGFKPRFCGIEGGAGARMSRALSSTTGLCVVNDP